MEAYTIKDLYQDLRRLRLIKSILVLFQKKEKRVLKPLKRNKGGLKMEVTDKQMEHIRIIKQEITDFTDDYSSISHESKIVEGHDDGSVRLEVTLKSKFSDKELTFYFEVYDDKSEFEIGEDLYEPLTEVNFWKEIAFEFWK